jgi:hypothetical protein
MFKLREARFVGNPWRLISEGGQWPFLEAMDELAHGRRGRHPGVVRGTHINEVGTLSRAHK